MQKPNQRIKNWSESLYDLLIGPLRSHCVFGSHQPLVAATRIRKARQEHSQKIIQRFTPIFNSLIYRRKFVVPFHKKTSGFTLLEVLIACAILAMAGITLQVSRAGNITRVRKAKLMNNIAFLLEQKMSEVLLQYEGKALSDIPEEESGDFGADYKNYKWKMESQVFVMPSLRANYMAQADEATTSELVITVLEQMKDYFSKSIKELKVTVTAEIKGKKPIEYSAVTYMVSYDQELAIPGMETGGGNPEDEGAEEPGDTEGGSDGSKE